MEEFSKLMMALGAIVFIVGGALWLLGRLDGDILSWIGKTPLDFKIEKENFTFYFPLGTSILISILLSLILYFFRKG